MNLSYELCTTQGSLQCHGHYHVAETTYFDKV